MNTEDILDFIDAVEEVKESKNQYAMSYAMALLENINVWDDETIKLQIMYILSNLRHWKGERATQVKERLTKILSEL